MAQFDAYENPNVPQRAAFPYLVVMQSDQFSHFSTRFSMPLARLPRPPADAPRRLAEPVEVNGEKVYPAAHLCAAVPARLLRRPVLSLRPRSDVFLAALDAVASGI
ncbi:MAG: CcdB family protein [Burkholderiales bacterium]|nr:CcdB family protein [Burkholderiales bacterium]